MKTHYKKTNKMLIYEFERVPKEFLEKRFIIDFFSQLPIEDLKRLINYKEINYTDKNQWKESIEMNEKLRLLMNERVVQIEAEIWLDNGVDDLSLGNIT